MTTKPNRTRNAFRSLIRANDGIPKLEVEPIRFAEATELPIPMSGETAQELGIKGIRWIEAYKKHGTYLDAYMEVNPKAQRATSCGNASKYAKKVMEACGGKDSFWEAMGVSLGSIGRVLDSAMKSKISRQFVLRDGSIVTAPPQEDVPSQIAAAKIAAQIRGCLKEGGGDQVLNISVTQYASPAEVAEGWPSKARLEEIRRFKGGTVDVTPIASGGTAEDPDNVEGRKW